MLSRKVAHADSKSDPLMAAAPLNWWKRRKRRGTACASSARRTMATLMFTFPALSQDPVMAGRMARMMI